MGTSKERDLKRRGREGETGFVRMYRTFLIDVTVVILLWRG